MTHDRLDRFATRAPPQPWRSVADHPATDSTQALSGGRPRTSSHESTVIHTFHHPRSDVTHPRHVTRRRTRFLLGRASRRGRDALRRTPHEHWWHQAVRSSAAFARMSSSRSAMSHGGSPATRMSMCILFLAVLPSGTRRKPMAGPTPSESTMEAPSGSSCPAQRHTRARPPRTRRLDADRPHHNRVSNALPELQRTVAAIVEAKA